MTKIVIVLYVLAVGFFFGAGALVPLAESWALGGPGARDALDVEIAREMQELGVVR